MWVIMRLMLDMGWSGTGVRWYGLGGDGCGIESDVLRLVKVGRVQ